jgi:predicted dehydrogenase
MRMGGFFKDYKVTACADLSLDAAEARAGEFGLKALTVEKLLADPSIEIVVNLTIPSAHFEVSKAILTAGKHVYSEKPYVLTRDEGAVLSQIAAEAGLRIGSAPDTFLGASHQKARQMIDEGAIGKVTSGTIHVMSNGMEDWHPNPDFFFLPGAGPVFDLGPYYITNLVQLLGPVERVTAMSSTPRGHRIIGSGPREGEEVPVKTPTTVHAVLQFHSGAIISYGTSWDVQAHEHGSMELYGETGTLFVPDPNFFAGELRCQTAEGSVIADLSAHPFAEANDGNQANYRGAGLADMAAAIRGSRLHRCNDNVALHAVEVMGAILASAEQGTSVPIETQCDRPAALDADAAMALIEQEGT